MATNIDFTDYIAVIGRVKQCLCSDQPMVTNSMLAFELHRNLLQDGFPSFFLFKAKMFPSESIGIECLLLNGLCLAYS